MKKAILPSVMRLTFSVIFGFITIWLVGFFAFFGFVIAQKQEAAEKVADLTVVLTGGTGRVEAGFDILSQGKSKALLISGVHRDVTLQHLADLWQGDRQTILSHCCITLGHKADDTESNAEETRDHIASKDVQSLRIVTSDYHMPRAYILFKRILPDKTLYLWPVSAVSPLRMTFWRNMFIEYSKTLLTAIS